MKRVFLAMSGGVDSSVAAVLLKERGYDVTGVFMKFWSPSVEGGKRIVEGESGDREAVPGTSDGLPATGYRLPTTEYCLWKEERADAARVAAKIGIPLLTWDFTHEYEKKVVEYMLEAYKAGITPNPDLMCNKEIKFGMFFEKALKEGADLVATGHYARIRNKESGIRNQEGGENLIPNSQFPIRYELLKALDLNKDQSYFLYLLEQCHLERTLFPIGDYTKPQIRELAKKFGLSTAEKKDSQGVCFIGPLKMKEFLADYIKPEKGSVVHKDGRVLGSHDGSYYYTIGQRHGLDLKLAGGPYLVIGKDVEKNIVYVGSEEDLLATEAKVTNIHWIGEQPELPAKVGVKIRYRAEDVPATLATLGNKESGIRNQEWSENLIPNSQFLIRFETPVRAIAPGQSAVFYDGDRVLGGGVLL